MTADAKRAARRLARQRRDAASATLGATAPDLIADHFLSAIPRVSGDIIAGYAAIGSEADPLVLLSRLIAHGHVCALPRVAAPNAALVFHCWRPGDALVSGAHGTFEPSRQALVCEPDILLVPLLAFDVAGRRLGYGGGYYDRSLSAFSSRGAPVLAVGVAFSVQEVQDLPEEDFDMRLDWIVTEKGARAFGGATPGGRI